MDTSETSASQSPDSSQVAVFSMKQAAQVAGISVSTLRRRRAELESAGAVISSEGWRVPITALEALGLMHTRAPKTSGPAEFTPMNNPVVLQQPEELDHLHRRIQKLEDENRELRHRAELAEAIARERAEALNAERMALRMIVASPSSKSPQEEGKNSSSPVHHQPGTSTTRASWLKRKFG